MFASKFIYELTGHPEPSDKELDEDIERLMFIKSIETPNYVQKLDERDIVHSDSEILCHWIRRRFEPALILLLLQSDDNLQYSRSELRKMESHKTHVERFFRHNFVRKRAIDRANKLCFDNCSNLTLNNAIIRLKKTITSLAKTLEQNKSTYTLLGTEAYTPADIILYNYLKRICVGKFKDMGLKTHVQQCDPIKQFMHLYATRNTHVIDISREDPLAKSAEESSLVADMTKPIMIAMSVVIFYMWRRDKSIPLSL